MVPKWTSNSIRFLLNCSKQIAFGPGNKRHLLLLKMSQPDTIIKLVKEGGAWPLSPTCVLTHHEASLHHHCSSIKTFLGLYKMYFIPTFAKYSTGIWNKTFTAGNICKGYWRKPVYTESVTCATAGLIPSCSGNIRMKQEYFELVYSTKYKQV